MGWPNVGRGVFSEANAVVNTDEPFSGLLTGWVVVGPNVVELELGAGMPNLAKSVG